MCRTISITRHQYILIVVIRQITRTIEGLIQIESSRETQIAAAAKLMLQGSGAGKRQAAPVPEEDTLVIRGTGQSPDEAHGSVRSHAERSASRVEYDHTVRIQSGPVAE